MEIMTCLMTNRKAVLLSPGLLMVHQNCGAVKQRWVTTLRFKSKSCPQSLSCVTSLSSKSAVLHPGPRDPLL